MKNWRFGWILAGLVFVGCSKQTEPPAPTQTLSATSVPPAAVASSTTTTPPTLAAPDTTAAIANQVEEPFPTNAEGITHYQAQPRGSKIKIEGDSTAHAWTMEGLIIAGSMDLGPGVVIDPAQSTIPGLKDGKVPAKVKATIPVRSIKSGHDIMDKLYQEALKEPKFPKIQYQLTEMKVNQAHVAGQPFEFDTTGQLSFSGVTNTVKMTVKMEGTKTALKIVGKCPLKMTDFGVEPPVINIGVVMKCKNEVTIVFDWALVATAATVAEKK